MKKSIQNLGKILTKEKQTQIHGGAIICEEHKDCPRGYGCCYSQMLCRASDYFTNGHCRGQ